MASGKANTVIIAVDDCEFSEFALEFYMDSLHRPGNTVILAHVTPQKFTTAAGPAAMGDLTNTTLPHDIESEERKTNALVEKLTEKINAFNLDTACIERIHGATGPALCTLASNKHADYIVVGCRGKGTLAKLVKGSVTDHIAHHSDVPVVIARHKDHLQHKHHHSH